VGSRKAKAVSTGYKHRPMKRSMGKSAVNEPLIDFTEPRNYTFAFFILKSVQSTTF
jgi:hypothetical protein